MQRSPYGYSTVRGWSYRPLERFSCGKNIECLRLALSFSASSLLGLILLLLRGLARLRRMRRELNDRLRFERLIAMLSTKLVNVPPEKVDQEVEKGLDEVVETMKLDRCALFELANDTGDLRITNKKVGADAVPFPLCKQHLPWLFEQTSLGKVVILPDLAQGLPAEANAEKGFFRNSRINSAVAFPFVQAAGTALAILYASPTLQ